MKLIINNKIKLLFALVFLSFGLFSSEALASQIIYSGNNLGSIKMPYSVSLVQTGCTTLPDGQKSCQGSEWKAGPGYEITQINPESGTQPEQVFFKEIGTKKDIVYDDSTGGSVTPSWCSLGLNFYVRCVANSGYEVESCPHQYGVDSPNYCEATKESTLPYGVSGVSFKQTAVASVNVYGVDLATNIEYEDEMTVPASVGDQPNVSIRWETKNTTSCSCSSGSDSCGSGYSTYEGESISAIGSKGNGDGKYALTQTKTFTVNCRDN